MDRDRLRSALRSPGTLRWVPLASLRRERVVSCIDGRHSSCTIGAPGGNAGELVLLLAVLEWYGVELDEPTVRAALRAVVERLGRFYLHTDRHAANRLAASVGWPADDVESLLRRPPVDTRDRLQLELADPRHVGCGHLKLLLERPEDYRVPRGLTEAVIRGFFELLWEGNPALELAVLEGDHHEEALVVFHTPERVDDDSIVPTWCSAPEHPVFVRHVPVSRWLRRDLLEAVASALPAPAAARLDGDEILLEVERLGERQLGLTMQALAPTLPRYRVRFADGRVDG